MIFIVIVQDNEIEMQTQGAKKRQDNIKTTRQYKTTRHIKQE